MNFIKGKIRTTIYENESGFFVGTFRVKETNDEFMNEYINKTITIAGTILDPNVEESYILYGEYIKHERFGYQYKIQSYEKVKPTSKDAVVEFLSSSLIKGCGEKTAYKIVDTLGENAIDMIKENINNLLLVPDMTEKKANSIYTSILNHSNNDDLIIELKSFGFTIAEATKLINKFKEKTKFYLHENLYYFKKYIDFNKLDHIYIAHFDPESSVRKKECILETMKRMSDSNGDIYYFKEEIFSNLKNFFKFILEEEEFQQILNDLFLNDMIFIEEDKYYLKENYLMEHEISQCLKKIYILPKKEIKNFEDRIKALENTLNVTYNLEQKKAILNALEHRISIISGGPGTGKTTIINAITKLYIDYYKLSPIDVLTNIALLAPTGRASKKLAESTHLPAMTIHRYLKWNKDTNDFGINEYNKNTHTLIIVDEMSMIDTYLFSSLLKGIQSNIQLILVGDTFQLPSVGAGLILNDLVDCHIFSYTPLEQIYRQSDNSYIAYLAKEIKDHNLSENFTEKKDDYNFFMCESKEISKIIQKICLMSLSKGLKVEDLQVLAPMYKGESGIDHLNLILQDLFNPPSEHLKEIKLGDVIFREKDKVLQLVNNPDCNVYNGDIGYIQKIDVKYLPRKKEVITIDFDGNYVEYNREDLFMIKHAYAITIHKSQGSEFPHVIMPISKNYYKMLYNKLIYTGVSRAKKSLVLVGEKQSFLMAMNNDYSSNRKTSLKNVLLNNF